jgi:hypothetical protein
MKNKANKVEQQEFFRDIAEKAEKKHQDNSNLAEQMEVLSRLAVATSSVWNLLDDLENLVAKGVPRSPEWFEADKPVTEMRAHMKDLFERFAEATGTQGDDLAKMRARLVEEPRPGHELISACRVMNAYTFCYVSTEMMGVSSMTTSLATEDRNSILDEMAREVLPNADSNRFLAQLRLSLLDDESSEMSDKETVDERSDDTERKAVARRRARIDEMVAPLAVTFRREVGAFVAFQLAACGPDLERATALRSFMKKIEIMDDNEVRTCVKRLLNLQMMFTWLA